MHDLTEIGPLERCNHKPCVCEGLGGYTKITQVEQKQVGVRLVNMEEVSLFEDVFSYSWLWPRRVG